MKQSKTKLRLGTKCKRSEGKRNVGRPIKRWADDLSDVGGKHWMEVARDRKNMERPSPYTGHPNRKAMI